MHLADLYLAIGNTPMNNSFQFTSQRVAREPLLACVAISNLILSPAVLAFESLDALVSAVFAEPITGIGFRRYSALRYTTAVLNKESMVLA